MLSQLPLIYIVSVINFSMYILFWIIKLPYLVIDMIRQCCACVRYKFYGLIDKNIIKGGPSLCMKISSGLTLIADSLHITQSVNCLTSFNHLQFVCDM